jgi:hypothetical protein
MCPRRTRVRLGAMFCSPRERTDLLLSQTKPRRLALRGPTRGRRIREGDARKDLLERPKQRCCISNHMLQSWSPGSFRKSIDGPLDEVEVTFELGELTIRAAIPVALDAVTNFDSVLALDKGKRKADPSNSLKRTNSAHSNLAVVLSQISVHASSLQVVDVLGTPPRELARPE